MKVGRYLLIKGRVQGVGYRYHTQREAIKLGLRGFVKNLPNGDVRVCVEGEKETVEYFISFLKKGPGFADVDEIKITEYQNENKYKDFTVSY